MQILSIRLKNIKSHRDTELSFSPGINVLSGPNGIGKSTIFEAIGYAMFGVDAQSFVGNVERFISIGANRGEITVQFLLADEERFRVSRTVGTPSKWLLAKQVAGEFEVEEHKDAKETEARLKQLLGLDNGRSLSEQFELVIGPFQHDFLGPFVIKQPAKRRDRFDEILGIDAWRKTFSETKTLVSAIKAKVEILQSAIGPLMDQVAQLPEQRDAHKVANREFEETQALLIQQQALFKQVAEQLVEIDKREETLKSLSVEIDTLKGRLDNGREKISAQQQLVKDAEKAQQIIAENREGRIAFEQSETRLQSLREQLKSQRQLEGEVAALDNQLGRLGERYASESRAIEQAGQDLLAEEQLLSEKRKELTPDRGPQQLADSLPEIHSKLEALRQQLGRLDGRRAGLKEGQDKLAEGICPFFQETCQNIADKPPGDVFSGKFCALDAEASHMNAEIQPLEKQELAARQASDQLKATAVQLKILDEQVEALAGKRKANETRASVLGDLQKQQQTVQQQLIAKQQELQAYSRLQTEIETAEQERHKYQPARDLYLANLKPAEELEPRQAELQKFKKLLTQLQVDLQGRETAFKQASTEYNVNQHLILRQQRDGLGQQIGALGQKLENFKAEIARIAAEIEKLKQLELEIKTKQTQIKNYGEKEELVKFLRNRVFRNVSAHLSERYREQISQRANRIYRIIAEVDEELVWGDNYQVVLRDMVDGELRERIDDQLSGGQTMSAVVALRLALLQTIGARIAFFDEPTSNLDVTRRENLAHAFRAIDVGREEVTEHWYDQLFLISHDVAFTEVTDQIIALDS